MVATASAVQKPAYRPRRYVDRLETAGKIGINYGPPKRIARHIDLSGLKCKECKRVYPIRDDLPIMLKDQATIEA